MEDKIKPDEEELMDTADFLKKAFLEQFKWPLQI